MSRGAGTDGRWTREVFRKSSRSNGGGSGQCVAVAVNGSEVAVGDTKTPVADTYANLRITAADLGGLVAAIKSGDIS
jgi:hypothetical protein